MSLKSKWSIARLILLAVLIIAAVTAASGCIKGITPIGWSGGVVYDNTIYVGSPEGRLVALNLADGSRQWSEKLKAAAQTGLFGCSPGMAGGCGTGSAGVAIYGTPVVSGELVYIAGYNGRIYAYSISTLAARWVYPREGYFQPFVGGLAIDQGRLYIGCSDGNVHALDAATGDPLWKSPFVSDDKIWSTPVVSGETLFVGSFDKKMYAVNTADGSKKWEFPTDGSIISAPLVYEDTLYFGALDRNFYALNAADGRLKWKITAENWFWAEPVIVNGTIYAGNLDGNIYIFKAADGARVAIIDIKAPVSSRPVVVDSSVIFTTRKGAIYTIDTVSHQAAPLADIELDVDGPLTAHEGIIYIHTQDIALQRVNAVSGAVLPPISLKKPE